MKRVDQHRVSLFLSAEAYNYFANLDPALKKELPTFITQILQYERLDTPDSKKTLKQLMENWSDILTNKHWSGFSNLVQRALNGKVIYHGDLNRHCLQILDALRSKHA